MLQCSFFRASSFLCWRWVIIKASVSRKTYNNRASTKFLIALLLLQCNYLFKSCRWRSHENLLPNAFSAAIQLCFYTKSSPLYDPWGGKSLLYNYKVAIYARISIYRQVQYLSLFSNSNLRQPDACIFSNPFCRFSDI